MNAFLDTPLADLVPVNYERKMQPMDYICAARVPERLKPQSFGPWVISRLNYGSLMPSPNNAGQLICYGFWKVGFPNYTLLKRTSWAKLHLRDSMDIVMEDSKHELQKHLPIWLAARGRVLVTGLGLGCVVRGLLAKKEVEHITVLEIDKSIIRVIGYEFEKNPRVTLVHTDALKYEPGRQRWEFAWHDLWTDGDEHLQCLHARLLARYRKNAEVQGAWELPRFTKRLVSRNLRLIG